MEENIERIKFTEVAQALKDLDHPFPARLLRGFSDLSVKDLREVISIWPEIPILRKQNLLEDLEEVAENDTLVCFDDFAKIVINDEDPMVRVLAIRLLWECEDSKIIPGIIDLMLTDPDEAVRATSASLLGRFVYLGELDVIPDAEKISIVKNLLDVVSSEDLPQVRLRALESLGYSSHSKVPEIIKTAFNSKDSQWVSSALCAMGRSADEQWNDLVLEKLDSGDSDVLFEAVRAAGELEITSALDQLLSLIEDDGCDPEVRLAVIWSLSQIGGDEVKEKFNELLEESESDEEIEWIEKAIENLEINGTPEGMEFFDFSNREKSENDDEDEEYGYEESDDDFEDIDELENDVEEEE